MGKLMNKLIIIGMVASIFLFAQVTAHPIFADEGYIYHHYKLHPMKGVPPLSNNALEDAIFYNQERLDQLHAEISANHKEIQGLRDQVAQLQKDMERFKNYYFRRM